VTACSLPQPSTEADGEQLDTDHTISGNAQTKTYTALSTLQNQATPTFILPSTITPSLTQGITYTPTPGYGSISGYIIGYPFGNLPQLTIVAFEQQAPYHYWYWINGAGNTYFLMDGYISSGKYQVVAYDPSSYKGGCPTTLEVKNDEMVTCDITDWGGSYPDKPAGVP
jgi:hypothetical protein